MTLRSSESLEQQAFFAWARMVPQARKAFAIPNGGHRNKTTAALLKAEGVTAGVLDVFLPVPRGGAHGLWIEFKYGRNRLTPEQAARAVELAADGYAVVVAYSATQAINAVLNYLRGQLPPGVIHKG